MRRIYAEALHGQLEEIELGVVHYEGCALVSHETLCGHVCRTDYNWRDTTKRANCKSCIAVKNHVLGKPW